MKRLIFAAALVCLVVTPPAAKENLYTPDGWRMELKISGSGGESEKLLAVKYDGVAEKNTFMDTFSSIEKAHGLRFVFDEGVDLSAEFDPSSQLGRQLGRILLWMARWKDLRYRWEDGAIRVSKGPYWEENLLIDGKDERLGKLLHEKLSIKTRNTPPHAVLRELGRKKGFSVVIGNGLDDDSRKIDGELLDYSIGRLLWMLQDNFEVTLRWDKGALIADAPDMKKNGMGMAIATMVKRASPRSDLNEDPLEKTVFPGYFLDTELKEIARQIAESAKLKVDVDPALESERMCIYSARPTVRFLLAVLHDLYGIGSRKMGDGGLALSRAYHKKEVRLLDAHKVPAPAPSEAKKELKISGKAGKSAGLLKRRLSISTLSTPLERLFWTMHRDTGLKLKLDDAVHQAGTVTGKYEGTELAQALAQLAELFQLSYSWEEDAVRVQRPGALPEVSVAFTSKAVFDSDLSVDDPQNRTMTLLVKDAPLGQVLESASAQTGRSFVPDAALKDSRVTLALKDAYLGFFLDSLHDRYFIGSRWSKNSAIPLSKTLFNEARRCRRRVEHDINEERMRRELAIFEAARAARRPVPERTQEEQRQEADKIYRKTQEELQRLCGDEPAE